MQVSLDLLWLDERIACQAKAIQRDRYRAVRLALDGGEAPEITRIVGRSRKFVQAWFYRYRDLGRAGLEPIKQPGRPPKLAIAQQQKLKERLDAGPREEDGSDDHTDVNTERMSQFLAGLSSMLDSHDLAIVVLDNAGWHRAKHLEIPANLFLLPLPSYSPELNPVERLWQWLRSHHLANRIYKSYDDLLQAANTAMANLDSQRLKTICACDYLTPPN